ncbi:MAG TPA: rRNA maturation RNase YbeY [Candidatus Limnocylindrales bacterium]|nr:rRNA maturation RNase YbeY [Candidatus Limnocylindrales bacterium]
MGKGRRAPKAVWVGHNLTLMENCQGAVRLEMASLERFLRRTNREIGLSGDAAFVRFVTDAEMARLNGKFRKRVRSTDVLSFPSEERTRPARMRVRVRSLRGKFLGDIAISPGVARRNAKLSGRSLSDEICILLLHGLLHLLGYDHETDRGEMERMEAKLRQRLGLAQ